MGFCLTSARSQHEYQRCKIRWQDQLWNMDVLDDQNAQNLEETLNSEQKSKDMEESIWKMNKTACGAIRSYLTQDTKHLVKNETSAWKL